MAFNRAAAITKHPATIVGTTATVVALTATLLIHWEGTDLTAKHNSFDPRGVITVCNGRTNYDDPKLKAGMKFTADQCRGFLEQDIPKYEAMLETCVPNANDMPPHRHAAFLSFTYNLGQGTVCKSSAVRYLNAGEIVAACNAMTLYDKANGVVLQGLKNRRTDRFWGERTWCLRND